jgi:hypothetical protein
MPHERYYGSWQPDTVEQGERLRGYPSKSSHDGGIATTVLPVLPHGPSTGPMETATQETGCDQAGPNIFSAQRRKERREKRTPDSNHEAMETLPSPPTTDALPVNGDGGILALTDEQQFDANQVDWLVAHLSKRQRRQARYERMLRTKKSRSADASHNSHMLGLCTDAGFDSNSNQDTAPFASDALSTADAPIHDAGCICVNAEALECSYCKHQAALTAGSSDYSYADTDMPSLASDVSDLQDDRYVPQLITKFSDVHKVDLSMCCSQHKKYLTNAYLTRGLKDANVAELCRVMGCSGPQACKFSMERLYKERVVYIMNKLEGQEVPPLPHVRYNGNWRLDTVEQGKRLRGYPSKLQQEMATASPVQEQVDISSPPSCLSSEPVDTDVPASANKINPSPNNNGYHGSDSSEGESNHSENGNTPDEPSSSEPLSEMDRRYLEAVQVYESQLAANALTMDTEMELLEAASLRIRRSNLEDEEISQMDKTWRRLWAATYPPTASLPVNFTLPRGTTPTEVPSSIQTVIVQSLPLEEVLQDVSFEEVDAMGEEFEDPACATDAWLKEPRLISDVGQEIIRLRHLLMTDSVLHQASATSEPQLMFPDTLVDHTEKFYDAHSGDTASDSSSEASDTSIGNNAEHRAGLSTFHIPR